MRNLHKIHTILNQFLLSQVWYWQEYAGYQVKLENNRIYYRYGADNAWEKVAKDDAIYILRRWKAHGSPDAKIVSR